MGWIDSVPIHKLNEASLARTMKKEKNTRKGNQNDREASKTLVSGDLDWDTMIRELKSKSVC